MLGVYKDLIKSVRYNGVLRGFGFLWSKRILATEIVKIGGSDVTVRGAVVNGVIKIGTAFIP